MRRSIITVESIQQRRSPIALREFVDHVRDAVRSDTSELKFGLRMKGLYNGFIKEIVPLSRFAAQAYPETYRIQPVLGNQGYDAFVFDETGTEVDRVEMTKPHDGEARAADAKLVVNRGYGRFREQDPGDDFNELVSFVLDTCKKKAQKDYGNCTLVVAIDPQPPFAAFDLGLRQSDAVRATLARRSGKAGCMTDLAMGCGKQGQGQPRCRG